MRFSINQSELLNALSIVQKGVSARSTLPVLAGIYVEAIGDQVTFQTTNLELSIQYTSTALVEEEGRAVFPGKLIVDIVKNLPDAAVHIEATDMDSVVTCESSSFSIKCLNPADFPGFPKVAAEQQIKIPFDTFSNMARKVCRVVSKDESRAILTGVLISAEDGILKMVAPDSYRLAVTEAPLAGVEEFNAVIAGSFVADLASLPKTGDDISFALAENQIIVSYRDTMFVNRRIEGRYPNYKQLIPASYETRCIVSKSAFSSAVRRASLLDHSGSQVRFSINAASQTIQLTTATQDVGSTQEIVKAQIEGSDVEIGFNSYYVNEGLSAIDSDEVAIEIQSSLKPGIIKGTGDENYLYLVMPVRI